MSVEQEIKDLIVEVLSVKPEEVKEDQGLGASLGVDSTEMVELNVALGKKFDVKIEPKEITVNNTPKDIAALIESKKAS